MAFSLSTTDTHAPAARTLPQVIRCACDTCGAHTNAVKALRVTGSCPNCGGFDLSPIDGAEPLGGPLAAELV